MPRSLLQLDEFFRISRFVGQVKGPGGLEGRDAPVVPSAKPIEMVKELVILSPFEHLARDRTLLVGIGRVEPDSRRIIIGTVAVGELPRPEKLHQSIDAVSNPPEIVQAPVEAGGFLKIDGA